MVIITAEQNSFNLEYELETHKERIIRYQKTKLYDI